MIVISIACILTDVIRPRKERTWRATVIHDIFQSQGLQRFDFFFGLWLQILRIFVFRGPTAADALELRKSEFGVEHVDPWDMIEEVSLRLTHHRRTRHPLH